MANYVTKCDNKPYTVRDKEEKKRKIKVTRKLLKQLKPFWRELKKIRGCYDIRIAKLEERSKHYLGLNTTTQSLSVPLDSQA